MRPNALGSAACLDPGGCFLGNESAKPSPCLVAIRPFREIKTIGLLFLEVVIRMEAENRNKTKRYVLSYSDGVTPAKVVHGWPTVMDERRRSAAKVAARGFHTEEVAQRCRRSLLRGSVTFQNTKNPQIVE